MEYGNKCSIGVNCVVTECVAGRYHFYELTNYTQTLHTDPKQINLVYYVGKCL